MRRIGWWLLAGLLACLPLVDRAAAVTPTQQAVLFTAPCPAFVPRVAGVCASPFANFATGQYFYNHVSTNSFSGWLSALSGTFARADATSPIASYVNSAGLIAFAGANVPRFTYDPVTLQPQGILLEGSRQNIALSSGDIRSATAEGNSITAWTAQATTAVLAAAGTAPDGVSAATIVTATAGTGDHERFQSIANTNVALGYSIFAKKGTANWVGIWANVSTTGAYFNLATGAVGTIGGSATSASIQAYPNGWYRLTVVATVPANRAWTIMPATVDNQAFNWNAAGTENILVWGADVEIGSFPSSYIPTTTVAVTRAADVFRLGLTGMVNLAGFTYFLQADPSQGVSQELLWSGEPGANDTTEAFNSTGSVYQSFLYASGGTVHADVTAGSPSTIKLAQAFSNVDLSVRASVNGSAVASASSSGTLKAVTDMTVGAFRTNATNNYFGKFQQLGIFPSMAIPNADLQRLTQ